MLVTEKLERYIFATPKDQKSKKKTIFMKTKLSEKSLIGLFDILHDNEFVLKSITEDDWDNAINTLKDVVAVEEDTFISFKKKIVQ